MKRLGGTDALFLSMETPYWHQHVAGLTMLDPEGRAVTFEDVVEKIDERIGYAPKFTLEAQGDPASGSTGRCGSTTRTSTSAATSVASPSRRRAAPRSSASWPATCASTQLDRRRPLWEIWYIEGAGRRQGRHAHEVPPLPARRRGRRQPGHRRCSTSSPTPPSRCSRRPPRRSGPPARAERRSRCSPRRLRPDLRRPIALRPLRRPAWPPRASTHGRQRPQRRREPGASSGPRRRRSTRRSVPAASWRSRRSPWPTSTRSRRPTASRSTTSCSAIVRRRAAPLPRAATTSCPRPRSSAAVPVSTRAEGDTTPGQPDHEHVRVAGHRRRRPGRAAAGHQPLDHERQGDDQGDRRPPDPVDRRGRRRR